MLAALLQRCSQKENNEAQAICVLACSFLMLAESFSYVGSLKHSGQAWTSFLTSLAINLCRLAHRLVQRSFGPVRRLGNKARLTDCCGYGISTGMRGLILLAQLA
jgi:hypothetical protein